MIAQLPPILIVEDNDDDFEACQTALTENHAIKNPIHRCESGEDALDYINHRGAYAKRADVGKPGIILLDLNLPGLGGTEVLSVLKADLQFKRIPIIVMTTPNDQYEVDRCYQFGANSYVVKPVQFSRFLTAIARIHEYWLDIALLPNVDRK